MKKTGVLSIILVCWQAFYPVLVMGLSTGSLDVDIIMRAGDLVLGMDESSSMCFRDCRCTVNFPRDGKFGTQRIRNNDGDSTADLDYTRVHDFNLNAGECPTGFEYKLQHDGNFVIYCGAVPSYSTRTHQNPSSVSSETSRGGYVLAIDDDCILHLYYHHEEEVVIVLPQSRHSKAGVTESEEVSSKTHVTTSTYKELWTSTRRALLKVGDRLGKGDIAELGRSEGDDLEYQDFASSKYSLVLDSSDGNLVLYQDQTSAGRPLWSASMEWASPPPEDMKDFFLLVKNNGHLVLMGVDYVNHSKKIYFDKVLANFQEGQGCFMVGYDERLRDLVAVPCKRGGGHTKDNVARLRGNSRAGTVA